MVGVKKQARKAGRVWGKLTRIEGDAWAGAWKKWGNKPGI